MPPNDRLAAAAHYLIARFPPSHMGAVKLNKVLWFSDCEFFRRHGRSLTGETSYVRKPNGPCVDRFEDVIASLKERNLISEGAAPTFVGHPRREFTSRREPDVSIFSAEEIDLLMLVGGEIARLSAQEASDLSHDALWLEAPSYGAIPIQAGAAVPQPLAEDEMDWARAAFA